MEAKFKIANDVDEKIINKFKRNQEYIETLNANDEVIAGNLPQAEATKFMEANKVELKALKDKTENLTKHRENMSKLGIEILENLQRINYPNVANKALAENRTKE